jgi:hypothetical protein
MGERSKTIGEIGENITKNFFDLIGWSCTRSNESLGCLKPQKHVTKSSKKEIRETHRIDYLYSYESPLENETFNNVICSVNNTDAPYPNNPVSKFKDYLVDLAQTIECFTSSKLKSEQTKFEHYKKSNDIGVIFWLSQSEETYDDVVTKLENCRIDSNLKFGSIYLVDNQRIKFIFQVVTHLKRSFTDHDILFYYPDTSMNYAGSESVQYGKFLPVEYINSPVIPFLLKRGKGNIDTFCIAVSDNFDGKEMPELIQAARKYTSGLSCNFLFLFPNYVSSKHDKDVRSAIYSFENENKNEIKNDVKVMSYKPDYRSLNDAG